MLFVLRPRQRMPASLSLIPSVQRVAHDEPRFQIPRPTHCTSHEWQAAARAEAEGGVAAEVRVFLDSQLSTADVLVDLAPGMGFVSLSAATAAGGTPCVLMSGITAADLRALQDAAIDVGSWVDEISTDSRPQMAALIESRLGTDGNVFVHVDALTVAPACQWLEPLIADGRVLAVCVSDAATSSHWPDAAAALAAVNFHTFVLQERDEHVIMMPVAGVAASAVIALPASTAHEEGQP